jgi:hypothetical protein
MMTASPDSLLRTGAGSTATVTSYAAVASKFLMKVNQMVGGLALLTAARLSMTMADACVNLALRL